MTSRLTSSSSVTSTRSPSAAPQRLGGVRRERLGDDQPDRRGVPPRVSSSGVPAGDQPAVVDDVDLVGEPLGLVHVVRGQHDGHAGRRAAPRAAPTSYDGRPGPSRRSARRRTRSRGGRRSPSPGRAAAAGRRRAVGTACGRTRRARAAPTSTSRSSGWACSRAMWRSISSARTPLHAPPPWSITPIRGSRSRRSRTGSSPSTRTEPCLRARGSPRRSPAWSSCRHRWARAPR